MRRKDSSDKLRLQRLLKKLRKNAGLRQVELADRLNRPQSFVSKYESGEKTLYFTEVIEICEILGICPHVFLNEYLEQK